MKRLVAVFLLVFSLTALAAQIVLSLREKKAPEIPDGMNILFFHAKTRCPTCLNMEKWIRKSLDDSFRSELEMEKIRFLMIPYDTQECRGIAERFHVGTVSLILLEQENGTTVRSLDLSERLWNHYGNEKDATDMLSDEFKRFLSP